MAITVINKKLPFVVSVIIIVLLSIVAVVLWVGQMNLDSKHKDVITRVISERGGQVEQINKVPVDLSPFKESKSNVIYKIFYTRESQECVAWYRGVKEGG